MLTFAVESGLHFLRMLESQALSKYRPVFIRLALQPLATITDLDRRRVSAVRAVDGWPSA